MAEFEKYKLQQIQGCLDVLNQTKKQSESLDQMIESMINATRISDNNIPAFIYRIPNLLHLIKVLSSSRNDDTNLGYSFAAWVTETGQFEIGSNFNNDYCDNVIQLFRVGKTQEGIEILQQYIGKQTCQLLKKFNFLPQIKSNLTEQYADQLKHSLLIASQTENQLISTRILPIIMGDFDAIVSASNGNWKYFAMLLFQFHQQSLNRRDLADLLRKQHHRLIFTDNYDTMLCEIAQQMDDKSIIDILQRYGQFDVAYFMYGAFRRYNKMSNYYESDLQQYKQQLIKCLLRSLPINQQYVDLFIYFQWEYIESIKNCIDKCDYQLIEEVSVEIVQQIADFNKCIDYIVQLIDVSLPIYFKLFEIIIDNIFNKCTYDDQQDIINALIMKTQVHKIQDQVIVQIEQSIMTWLDPQYLEGPNKLSNYQRNQLKIFLDNYKSNRFDDLFRPVLCIIALLFGSQQQLETNPIHITYNSTLVLKSIQPSFVDFIKAQPTNQRRRMQLVLSQLLRDCSDVTPAIVNKKKLIRLLISKL